MLARPIDQAARRTPRVIDLAHDVGDELVVSGLALERFESFARSCAIKVSDAASLRDQMWYSQRCREHGWSWNIRRMQSETQLHECEVKAHHNFQATLRARSPILHGRPLGYRPNISLPLLPRPLVAEGVLHDVRKPIGVAEYRLTTEPPGELERSPSELEELETVLGAPVELDSPRTEKVPDMSISSQRQGRDRR